ncbi:MAG: serine/threonine protein phosphatase [Pirellulaceae bacterium]|jgi:serine/threonine protein phosphatase 1|nr:serine/threonine protein phosphatase [Pirellulaceae bacterium]
MSGRLIAIGDIHGCTQALDTILATIGLESDDTFVALGDYVDRGPDSKGVIDRLIALRSQCNLVPLFGNHEEMMLDVVRDGQPPYRWLQYGGVETLDSYRFAGDMDVISKEHRDFFASLLDYYETDEHFFVHANYDPQLALAEQPRQLLRWQKLTDSTPAPHVSGKRAVVGHTHDQDGEIFDIGHLICLDTYCYGGGWLTALDMNSGEIWQSNMAGELR